MADILITGATRGIGRATALMLARHGHRVIGAGRTAEDLETLGRESSNLYGLRMDVSDPASVQDAVGRVMEITDGRGLDVVINNAGYAQVGPVELISEDEWLAQYQTNVFGMVRVTRAFLPSIRANKGRIINVSSVAGRLVLPFFGPYNSTKHAVEAISDALRQELRVHGVEVVLIEPGPVKTGFGELEREGLVKYAATDSAYRKQLEQVARFHEGLHDGGADPRRVAATVVKALEARRPRARYVTPWLKNRIFLVIAEWSPTWVADGVVRIMSGLGRVGPG